MDSTAEDVRGACPNESEDKISLNPRVGRRSPQRAVKIRSHKITDTLDALAYYESDVGTYTLDMIAPPMFSVEITQFSTMKQKRFLRNLRTGRGRRVNYRYTAGNGPCRMKELPAGHQ